MGRLISLTSLPSPLSYRYVSLSLLPRLHRSTLSSLGCLLSFLLTDFTLILSHDGGRWCVSFLGGAQRRMREKGAVQRDLLPSAGLEAAVERGFTRTATISLSLLGRSSLQLVFPAEWKNVSWSSQRA